MDMKHTPGPWQYQRGPLTVFTCSDGETGITQAVAALLNGNGDFDRATVKANACLIAAAPDLLAASQALLTRRLGGEGDTEDDDRIERDMRAAIAKATGAAE